MTHQVVKVVEECGNRCLAVGTRNAHQLQLLGWVVVEGGGEVGHSGVAILHHNITYTIDQLLGQSLTHHSHSATLDGRGDVVVTIRLRASHGKEAVARRDLA